ncbi:MAG: hydrogenase expression/formation protein HypE [Planctomycetaceae bacterium]|nr:hydrogenase expression/formation protein HypE [Planctomycetaceae bacterium]
MSTQCAPVCALPNDDVPGAISLAHGEGGRLMRDLLRRQILPLLGSPSRELQEDAAVLAPLAGPPVFTTDSFVVSPRFFPGGDLGSLAIHGTVNDLAVAGARPRWLSCSLILEEGFDVGELRRLLGSAANAARMCGVHIVTGDTKVVPRGAVDGLFINTAGLGELVLPMPGPASMAVGDELLVSGPIGRHGMAVLAARESLQFEPTLESDSAPLYPALEALRLAGVPVKAARDATRGGVSAVLHEWAESCALTLAINGTDLPVTDSVRGACELLGLDPLHVACEGTMVIVVPSGTAAAALSAMRSAAVSASAAQIGEVMSRQVAPVVVRRALRRLVPLDEPVGAALPRIC